MNEMESKTTPKDFFLWLGAISALYVSAVSLLMLFFEYIDKLFADPLETYVDPFSGQIRFAIASLIIIFPLYLYLTRILNKGIRANALKKEIWVRRWLIYFTLFAAGLTIVIDLIVLINTFLGGEELTTAFLLKVLSILVVIGGAFYYYLQDIKGRWEVNEKLSKTIGGLVSLVVIASVVGGFFIMGTPQEQRALRFDQDRVYHLQDLQRNLTTYYQQKEVLPERLEDLEDPLIGFYLPVDPETEKEYDYSKTGDLTFELCATFNTESKESKNVNRRPDYYGFDSSISWEHKAGHTCFERTIDPDKFPQLNEKPRQILEF
jgi:hypothetical protein